jgi:hypothetical protein
MNLNATRRQRYVIARIHLRREVLLIVMVVESVTCVCVCVCSDKTKNVDNIVISCWLSATHCRLRGRLNSVARRWELHDLYTPQSLFENKRMKFDSYRPVIII